jgi:hypothetical protein
MMATPKSTVQQTMERANRCARILANGGKRSDCIRFCAETWGVSSRQTDTYIKKARELMRADWDMERYEMVAELLSQSSTLQMEARKRGQLSVALGCINTAARLAQLVS